MSKGPYHVSQEAVGGVATITIRRPQVLNALDLTTLSELRGAIEQVSADDEVRSVIVTGAGERAFVAGADIGVLDGISRERAREFLAFGQEVFNGLAECPKPTIAAINGAALGGGLELAMACDIRIAADRARFGQPEIRLGSFPGWGGTQRLPMLVGLGRAREMILTGRIIDAAEALWIGLVSRVVPAAELMPAARALAMELAQGPSVAQRLAKETLRYAERDLAAGLHLERENVVRTCATRDQREGTRAFLEKRAPQFRGS